MILSMTGFGKSSGTFENKKITVEIRSLNSKQLDLGVRMPSSYREKEMELRGKLGASIERGKADCVIYYENLGTESQVTINKDLAANYAKQLREMAQSISAEVESNLIPVLMRMPEILGNSSKEFNADEWNTIGSLIEDCMKQFSDFRQAEGNKLEIDLSNRVNSILNLLEKTNSFEAERMSGIRTRIEKSMNEYVQTENIDRNRFEQELIYYMERLDVNEEKQRLKTHCNYFFEVMKNEKAQGRKLGFIAQEMGREINTLGSKCNHSEIQKVVVLMKDELEKIKEQILNVL